MYIGFLLATILVAVILAYSIYCLIDLFMFKLKIIATNGRGTMKHINVYRFILRLHGGDSPARVPDTLFRIGIAKKIDIVITIVTLILTIILIGITATLSVFHNSTAAVIRNNYAIIQERREETTDEWVDEKDDERHEGETDSSEASSDSSSTSESVETTDSQE